MKNWIFRALATLMVICALPLQAEESIVRLATTTSTYNSGLLDALLPSFETKHNLKVQVIAVGTGKALRMGEAGDVDLVMTHAPAAEQKFVDAGFGVEPTGLMYNDFVLIGPAADPAQIRGNSSAVDAMKKIADSNSLFISRGDDSGTHKKEKGLWKSAGVDHRFENYREVGQGMGKVLQMADELNAYTLTDRGTWLAYESRLQLQLLVEGDEGLFNPYQVILVNPSKHEGLNTEGARALRDWLISDEGQQQIDAFKINGKPLFKASAAR